MIQEINKIFIKSNIYKANYVYIYSDFRKFFYLNKNNRKSS